MNESSNQQRSKVGSSKRKKRGDRSQYSTGFSERMKQVQDLYSYQLKPQEKNNLIYNPQAAEMSKNFSSASSSKNPKLKTSNSKQAPGFSLMNQIVYTGENAQPDRPNTSTLEKERALLRQSREQNNNSIATECNHLKFENSENVPAYQNTHSDTLNEANVVKTEANFHKTHTTSSYCEASQPSREPPRTSKSVSCGQRLSKLKEYPASDQITNMVQEELVKAARIQESRLTVDKTPLKTETTENRLTKKDFYPQVNSTLGGSFFKEKVIDADSQVCNLNEGVNEKKRSPQKTAAVELPEIKKQQKPNSRALPLRQIPLQKQQKSNQNPQPAQEIASHRLIPSNIEAGRLDEIKIQRANSRSKLLDPIDHPPIPRQNMQDLSTEQLQVKSQYLENQEFKNITLPSVLNSPSNILSSNSLPKMRKSNLEHLQKTDTIAKENELQRIEEKSPNIILPRNSVIPIPNPPPLLNAAAFVNQIYCQSLNSEPFVRRAVQKLGWTEIPQISNKLGGGSGLFHIRFNISDLEGSAIDLKPNQFYNHHPQNREFTTKAGLCKNLWQGCFSENELKISEMFPRCYDLSDLKQSADFVSDFNQTACLSIIKIMTKHFIDKNSKLLELFNDYQRALALYEQPRVFKKKFKVRCARIDVLNSNSGNLLGLDQLRYAYTYAKTILDQRVEVSKQVKVKSQSLHKPAKLTSDTIQQLVDFHKRLVEKGVPQFGISTYEQFQMLKINRQLEKFIPQYKAIDGSHNMWIVKPSYNARGVGIYCS